MIPAKQRDGTLPRRPRQAVSEVSPDRAVSRPVPESQRRDARGYQIEQLRRRFAAEETRGEENATRLRFRLAPSDPDFPFELDRLECDLLVPAGYPGEAPRLRVRNADVPRGFALNVERGWDGLVRARGETTLLALANALDKNLEAFLAEQKAETVKLSLNAGPLGKETKKDEKKERSSPRYVPEESFTGEQIAEATARRAREVRQLEARMGRLALYRRSSDGIVYTLPLAPAGGLGLPAGLRSVDSVQLIVPLLYPLQPLRVLLNNAASQDAEGAEELFAETAARNKDRTLMSHVNFLAQNLGSLARAWTPPDTITERSGSTAADEAREAETAASGSRGHIRVIPRPPEWDAVGDESGDSSDEFYGDSDGDDENGQDENAENGGNRTPGNTAERGTALMFPSIELRGIELLRVSVLGLGVRCQRCRTVNEVGGLGDGVEKAGRCRKCTAAFAVRFRPELVHANSTRAGFIDAVGCVAVDLLPSTFVPTCAACSTPSGGLVSVRGDSTTNVCRECHGRFTFAVPQVKFLAYAPGAPGLRLPNATRLGPHRRIEDGTGRAGEPLPDRGACGHYRRSHRWFRFSCCGRVHPCDRCHDAAEDHPNERAERMVCGWCAREQRYAPESCAFCGRSVIGKRGKGYWEGGRGTRDKLLMRRGDKRKYRRPGGGEVARRRGDI